MIWAELYHRYKIVLISLPVQRPSFLATRIEAVEAPKQSGESAVAVDLISVHEEKNGETVASSCANDRRSKFCAPVQYDDVAEILPSEGRATTPPPPPSFGPSGNSVISGISNDQWEILPGKNYRWKDWRLVKGGVSFFIWCDAVAMEFRLAFHPFCFTRRVEPLWVSNTDSYVFRFCFQSY
ncbi:unnamed protein product [Gongylonema pulchrum]|uniref:PH domain-containing protein n=1 Tax=Gongylonema pulchrum TaxID=637853 RepID=A0A183DG52_9BILA|nr:unnamed protein product [Gongylonema pulchrum]